MVTLLQNPCSLNTLHSNSSLCSSLCVNFRSRCSNPQNFCHNAQFLPHNLSQKYRVSKPVSFASPGEAIGSEKHHQFGILHPRPGPKVKTKHIGNFIHRKLAARASEGEENPTAGRRSFLSFEEAGLVEMSGLSTHERFLCRLTISSLNLLKVIAEQEGCEIEELNAGRICDWFIKDKLKREQDIGSSILQWEDDSDDFQF